MKTLSIKTVLGVLIIAFMVSSCAISVPMVATNNKSIKEGRASVSSFFGFTPMNADLSIKTAAENGGIKKVATVDILVESKLLGIQQKVTTVVTGE